MKTSLQSTLFAVLSALSFSLLSLTSSHAATVDTLLTQALPPLDAKEVQVITVTYDPGEFSMPHRHNAYVFVYVLEGNLEMQVDGGEVQQLGPGDTFQENPDDIHRVSRNISDGSPAKFLVFFIKEPGADITTPLASH